MDPLGAPSQFVDVDSLPGWTDAYEAKQLDSHQNPVEKAQVDVRSPFPYRKDINAKIILWKGDVALLNCTAIVNTSNESLTDKNPVSESIFMHAGPDLRDELQKLKGTVRRFLEIHGETLEKVVFAVSEHEEATYQKLLPLYFPRSLEEEIQSLPYLPADIGNAEGEPVVPERQIRITEKPGVPDDASDEEGLEADLSFIGSHAFARMEGDVDKQRRLILQGQLSEAALQKQHQRNYNRWLCQARAEDLSDIASLKALYQTGVDNCGRTVMVVVGRNIPVTLIDMEKALLYFIHVMDHIAVKEYVLVYFHTLTNDYNQLDSNFLKKLYDVVDAKYKRNLKALYFVHPTFRSKVSAWFFTTFTVSGLKDKIHYVESLQQLFTAIPPEQIDLPPFVLEYDARENGPYYSSYPPSPDL
ncbi:PREDICTED: ganglioside-induced differentiation-associated protein 2 isoform X2 [Pygoscelis adeliae]|uniref:ganglioside-induced differentiation-associated protein 2 isoform X2 n=1 Tax=Pygoscelis adeliae TaxID=9238 RepID=UPI0004F4EFB8|nr:PREDICTED: ganglioside-induced differentiation-associated protein 2 isoform X2 [Pygoscelis adeliae]